jgi:hypothetical protein
MPVFVRGGGRDLIVAYLRGADELQVERCHSAYCIYHIHRLLAIDLARDSGHYVQNGSDSLKYLDVGASRLRVSIWLVDSMRTLTGF